MKFEYFVDAGGDWRWRLRAANGKIIADSGEGYQSRANVKRAIRELVEAVRDAVVIEAEK